MTITWGWDPIVGWTASDGHSQFTLPRQVIEDLLAGKIRLKPVRVQDAMEWIVAEPVGRKPGPEGISFHDVVFADVVFAPPAGG